MVGRMNAQAVVDESGRGSSYHVCVAVIAKSDVQTLRRLSRSFCMPGQRRWHCVNESMRRRRQIADALVASGQVSALIFHATGQENAIRTAGFCRMVEPLIEHHVTRLIIQSREGRDHFDRQVLVDELRRRAGGFEYDQMPAPGDLLLWIADAVAWCSSAGGTWRERIGPLIVHSENVAA